MTTTAQIAANQSNAQHSTGPRTAEGIQASSHNATSHGLTGKQIVIKGEDPAAYDALRSQLLAQHAPANELEAMLVEQIAQNWWRIERARRIESKMLDEYGAVEAYERKGFLNLQRQLTRVESAWNKAVRDLAKLQRIRREEAEDAALASQHRTRSGARPNDPSTTPIGFVFANPNVQPTEPQFTPTAAR